MYIKLLYWNDSSINYQKEKETIVQFLSTHFLADQIGWGAILFVLLAANIISIVLFCWQYNDEDWLNEMFVLQIIICKKTFVLSN